MDDVLESIPLDAVVEMHVAGGRVNRTHPFRYIDSHSDPIAAAVYHLLKKALRLCRGVRAVTYEIGVQLSSAQMDADFAKLEAILQEADFTPRLTTSVAKSGRT